MLCNLFCLLGLALQIYRLQNEGQGKTFASVLYAGMNLAFFLALLSKPSAIVVIPIAWIIAVGILRKPVLISALELTPGAAVAVIISVVAKQAQGNELLSFIPTLGQRPLIAGDAIAFYLYKLFFPFALSVDYARTPESIVQGAWIWWAWLVPAGLAGALALLPHKRFWLISLAIFVVALLPVSGLVSFLFQYYSTVSDRYVYLAMLGPSLAVAWFFTFYPRPQLILGFAVLLGGMTLLSSRQAATWKSAETLYEHALAITPAGFLTQSGLGSFYADAGQTREAIKHLTFAAEIKPDSSGVHHKLGTVLIGAGRVREAIPHFQDVVRLKPDWAEAHNDLGVALGKAGRPAEAIEEIQQAIRRKPEELEFHTNLMVAYSKADRRDEAIATAEQAIELARSQGQAPMAANIEAWLRNYRATKP